MTLTSMHVPGRYVKWIAAAALVAAARGGLGACTRPRTTRWIRSDTRPRGRARIQRRARPCWVTQPRSLPRPNDRTSFPSPATLVRFRGTKHVARGSLATKPNGGTERGNRAAPTGNLLLPASVQPGVSSRAVPAGSSRSAPPVAGAAVCDAGRRHRAPASIRSTCRSHRSTRRSSSPRCPAHKSAASGSPSGSRIERTSPARTSW